MSNPVDAQYQELLQAILDYGVIKKDRTGTGTKSMFGYTFRHNMSWGFLYSLPRKWLGRQWLLSYFGS